MGKCGHDISRQRDLAGPDLLDHERHARQRRVQFWDEPGRSVTALPDQPAYTGMVRIDRHGNCVSTPALLNLVTRNTDNDWNRPEAVLDLIGCGHLEEAGLPRASNL